MELSFEHHYTTENSNAGGYVQISVNGGPWNTLSFSYTGICGVSHPAPSGTEIFYGSSVGWIPEYFDLSSYAGDDIRLRFVFGADAAYSGGNWQLDNFNIEAKVTGWEITSIEFLATTFSGSNSWTFDNVDVYMDFTPDTVFDAGGMWDISDMQLVADDYTLTANWSFSDSVWNEIVLDDSYFLPEEQNLMIKIVKYDAVEAVDIYDWGCIMTPEATVRHESGTSPPTALSIDYYLPAIRINTPGGTLETPPADTPMPYVPMDAQSNWSDFEAIYTAGMLGASKLSNWTHGGSGDDWEFGQPLFIPDVDPALRPENENNIAGTDLTDDGYYPNDKTYWLMSEPYVLPDTLPVSIMLRYFRCLRLAPLDLGFVHVGFSDNQESDPLSVAWDLVKTYSSINQTYWNWEDVNVTTEFYDAKADGRNYFYVMYTLSSNTADSLGGWNLDNVQFLGSSL